MRIGRAGVRRGASGDRLQNTTVAKNGLYSIARIFGL